MIIKFFIYGFLGLLVEIFFTGIHSFVSNDYTLIGHTYIWMIFIYGWGALLEKIHDLIRDKNFILRGGIWVVLILSIEFITGILLKKLIGICPWDYTGSSPYQVMGVIRLDYIPYWFVLGLIFEKIHDSLDAFIFKLKMTPD